MRRRLGILLVGVVLFATTGCDLEDVEDVSIRLGGFGAPSIGLAPAPIVVEETYYEEEFYYEDDYGYGFFDCWLGC